MYEMATILGQKDHKNWPLILIKFWKFIKYDRSVHLFWSFEYSWGNWTFAIFLNQLLLMKSAWFLHVNKCIEVPGSETESMPKACLKNWQNCHSRFARECARHTLKASLLISWSIYYSTSTKVAVCKAFFIGFVDEVSIHSSFKELDFFLEAVYVVL